jgi:signal transduction histidine kinase
MKEEFLQSIVHDLRSPLNAIEVFLQISAPSQNLSEREKKYMGYASDAARRIRNLVSDILDMAKLESGTMTLKLEPVTAASIIENMRSLYTLQAQARQVSMDFVLGNPAPEMRCDRQLIERVVMNLLGNALKFTPSGGRITLTIADAGANEEEFSVQDTGSGIPKNSLALVFEKFKQLDEGLAARSGYGLGLTICKRVVELHGGRIWVESEEGKGSRFVFRIPKAQVAASTKAAI